MELIFGIVLGLLSLVFLVVIHELGHAIVSKRNGVVVEEFGIGFPPRAWGRKLKNGILFSINWLPLGGFVKLQGEHDAADKKGDYGATTFWNKTKILFAGVAINWLAAALILTVLAFIGMPKVLNNQFTVPSDSIVDKKPIEISSVTEGYPATLAGIEVNDQILSIDGRSTTSVSEFIDLTKSLKGKTVALTYVRDGNVTETNVKLRDSQDAVFGAGLSQRETIRSTWSSPIVGVATTAQLTGLTFQGLGDLVANLFSGLFSQFSPDQAVRDAGGENIKSIGDGVAGPVGILGTIFPQAEQAGPVQFMFLTAIISLTLAVMNILPIPALDGGRWFTMAIFRLIKKPLTKDTEEKIQASGFMILMALIILVTIADLSKLF